MTSCRWRGPSDAHWWQGLELPPGTDDGQYNLLDRLFNTSDEYVEWLEDYCERPIDLEAVALLMAGAAITPELISRLDPERNVKAVMDELTECGLIAPGSGGLGPPEA